MKTIKKQKSRELYDRELKKRITLKDVHTMMHQGIAFRVVDHDGEDITISILDKAIKANQPTVHSVDYVNQIVQDLGFFDSSEF